jgi:hypothetical protein
MSPFDESLKLGITSLKKPITKAHLPDVELWPSSADVGFPHDGFVMVLNSDFTVIVPIDFTLIMGRYSVQNLDLLPSQLGSRKVVQPFF